MKRKVILYVGGFELPDKNAAAQRCVSNAKIFRDLGYEVVLLGVDKDSKSSLKKSDFFGFSCWDVPYPRSVNSWLKHITSLNQVDYLLEHEYKNKVFAVICYNHPAISQYRIKNIAKRNGALAIADVTEWYAVSGNSFFHKAVKWLDVILRMRVVNFFMDGIVTTSDYLTKFYNKKNILVELPTLYDKSQVGQLIGVNRSQKNSCYKLVYAGTPFDVSQAVSDKSSVKERLDLVLKTLFEVSKSGVDYELSIFGLTKADYLKVYPEDAQEMEQVEKKILFKGRCSHQEVLEEIISSDFTIFLRDITRVTQAGFPSKFAESITYGTPVITNLISNIEPYIEEGKNCYLVDIDDEGKRVRKLKEILSLPQVEVAFSKKYCLETDVFDYVAHTEKVGDFFQKVEAKNEF
ncbi:MAG: glycosyltransferase [Methylomarinum sp.]|nr:glycosyltransferase [Methylomarinum sp.]